MAMRRESTRQKLRDFRKTFAPDSDPAVRATITRKLQLRYGAKMHRRLGFIGVYNKRQGCRSYLSSAHTVFNTTGCGKVPQVIVNRPTWEPKLRWGKLSRPQRQAEYRALSARGDPRAQDFARNKSEALALRSPEEVAVRPRCACFACTALRRARGATAMAPLQAGKCYTGV
jgi:hypothetical protein